MINIIPAIDLIDGCAIRLSESDYSTKKMYFRDPVDAAKILEHTGISNLHVVDLDNAKAGKYTDKNDRCLQGIGTDNSILPAKYCVDNKDKSKDGHPHERRTDGKDGHYLTGSHNLTGHDTAP